MPLASVVRPKHISEFLGQDHLVGEGNPIRMIIESGKIPSMLFWGPPASGKTTLAEIISRSTDADFVRLSAVVEGKKELRNVIHLSATNQKHGRVTILFIDEIHRWSKAQQDALLPYVESGQIVLIGATTENPSFTIIAPLVSRARVFVFQTHEQKDVVQALQRGKEYLGASISTDLLEYIAQVSQGDMRFALNTLELTLQVCQGKTITRESISRAAQKSLLYDKKGEEHYNIISAIHKSLRSSNASAAVYWISRMLEAGDDPLYIARRLLRYASEDIGNVNPNALLLANTVYDTCHKIGMPECGVSLAQLAEYLAHSSKSNAAYIAYEKARADVKKYGALPVPLHFRNAPTQLMKDIGYGEGYQYDHELASKKSNQACFPEQLQGTEYFSPDH